MIEVGRNDPCSCGSGKKFKKCCESKSGKRSIGPVQILSNSGKVASLFQRVTIPKPIVTPQEAPNLVEE